MAACNFVRRKRKFVYFTGTYNFNAKHGGRVLRIKNTVRNTTFQVVQLPPPPPLTTVIHDDRVSCSWFLVILFVILQTEVVQLL
jgi:hypothetical protein